MRPLSLLRSLNLLSWSHLVQDPLSFLLSKKSCCCCCLKQNQKRRDAKERERGERSQLWVNAGEEGESNEGRGDIGRNRRVDEKVYAYLLLRLPSSHRHEGLLLRRLNGGGRRCESRNGCRSERRGRSQRRGVLMMMMVRMGRVGWTGRRRGRVGGVGGGGGRERRRRGREKGGGVGRAVGYQRRRDGEVTVSVHDGFWRSRKGG